MRPEFDPAHHDIAPMGEDELVRLIAAQLRPLIAAPEYEDDPGTHDAVRKVVRAALRRVGCPDLGGCPLCLG